MDKNDRLNESLSLLTDRSDILTEQYNPRSSDIDTLSTLSLLKIFTEEDLIPQKAVSQAIYEIQQSVDQISSRLSNGGRLFYLGAGTSGRLGVLDAAE